MAKVKRQKDAPKIAEHYLHNFLRWESLHRAHHKGADRETFAHVARLIERVLAGDKNPMSKRGRPSNLDTTKWLCFHLLRVVPITSNAPALPKHSNEGGGFNQVGKKLHLEAKTVESYYYDASKQWKTSKGRQSYIDWLNHREKIWETYQSTLEKREPIPREYVLPAIAKLDYLICTRSDESGENYIALLSDGEAKDSAEEARQLMTSLRGKEDYEHWRKHRNAGPLRVRLDEPRRGKRNI